MTVKRLAVAALLALTLAACAGGSGTSATEDDALACGTLGGGLIRLQNGDLAGGRESIRKAITFGENVSHPEIRAAFARLRAAPVGTVEESRAALAVYDACQEVFPSP